MNGFKVIWNTSVSDLGFSMIHIGQNVPFFIGLLFSQNV